LFDLTNLLRRKTRTRRVSLIFFEVLFSTDSDDDYEIWSKAKKNMRLNCRTTNRIYQLLSSAFSRDRFQKEPI